MSYLYGSEITPFFFDSRTVENETDFVRRVLPFMKTFNDIEVLYTEKDKKNFRYGHIVAQPDAVLKQWKNLLTLEYKSLSGTSNKLHDKNRWEQQIRLKDILQAIINSLQVSIVEDMPCVTLLRYVNVVYYISPSAKLCQYILDKALDAKNFYHEKNYVSSSQLSDLLEPLVKKMFELEETEAQKQGKKAHESMLRAETKTPSGIILETPDN